MKSIGFAVGVCVAALVSLLLIQTATPKLAVQFIPVITDGTVVLAGNGMSAEACRKELSEFYKEMREGGPKGVGACVNVQSGDPLPVAQPGRYL